jgi:hypothetical protein
MTDRRPTTYREMCANNWPRPTCRECGLPRSWKTLFDGLCQFCYAEQPFTYHLAKKEIYQKWKALLPLPPTS